MDYNQNNFNQNDNTNNGWSYGSPPFYNQPPMNNVTSRGNELASSSKTLGILGIVLSIICCPLIGLIMGIMAMSRAKTSKMMLGTSISDAKIGRVCGIIALLISIVWIVALCISGYAIYLGFLETLDDLNSMSAFIFFFL